MEQRQTALTPQVASEHEVQDKETVFVVLERVTHVHDERVVDLVRMKTAYIGKPRNPEPKTVSYSESGTRTLKPDLFEQPPLLDDIGDGSLFRALRLVDILQCEQLL